MARIGNLSKPCGVSLAKGTRETLYATYTDELSGMPATAADNGGTAAGDTKIYDEAWDFTGAPAGQGYWRSAPILINTGQVRNADEGEVGGKTMMNEILGFIPGNDAATREFIDCLRSAAGCGIFMLSDKNGLHHVVGSILNPAYVDITEGGTGGDRVGYDVRIYADYGATNMQYDADTYAIEITPNV